MDKQFIISIYTENSIGILNRITIIFTRRHINIESLTAGPSEIDDVHRYTIVVNSNEQQVKKIVAQVDKQIEVISTFYHTKDQVIPREVALYKISIKRLEETFNLNEIIKNSNASTIFFNQEFAIIEKTGTFEETDSLLNSLKPYGLLQFVRSGIITVTHSPMLVSKKLLEFNEKINK